MAESAREAESARKAQARLAGGEADREAVTGVDAVSAREAITGIDAVSGQEADPAFEAGPGFEVPRIPASAGAMIFDCKGRLLILKPTYKAGWTIPGGEMEADGETPWEACQREVAEECGLTVRRATPAAAQVFSIRDADIGRRLGELNPTIDVPDLEILLKEVIDTLTIREKQVCDNQGRQFLLRIRPYRTADNKIDGAVLTLLDLTEKPAGERRKKI